METLIAGGLVRAIQGLVASAPTLLVGLLVASILRYYLGPNGTRKFFGGDSLRSLPQSWLIGMLLPVCSIGVIPIIREMKRVGIRPGAITAFAVSAPLFNPLSLMYGLTLSRPAVIIGFAFASLIVVTVLGLVWDRFAVWQPDSRIEDPPVVGLRRLGVCTVFMARELFGPTGGLTMVAVGGLFFLGTILPHGSLQSSVEQMDPWAPLNMAMVSIPIYAPPMLTMSQLGMMFAHGNSPGAAFCLLLLGSGVNLATILWLKQNYGWKATGTWSAALIVIVLACAYALDRPLIPPGIEPAGHTHAFDIYTNPFPQGMGITWADVREHLTKSIQWSDWIAIGMAISLLFAGLLIRTAFRIQADAFLRFVPAMNLDTPAHGLHRKVSSRTVGLTCLAGLIAFSIVTCFAYYPAPEEALQEIRLARVEVLSGSSSQNFESALHWIPILDEWSRRLEVGYAIRHFHIRPYQQMQAHLLRKKLELLEHAVEHASDAAKENSPASQAVFEEELAEMKTLQIEIMANGRRLTEAFQRQQMK